MFTIINSITSISIALIIVHISAHAGLDNLCFSRNLYISCKLWMLLYKNILISSPYLFNVSSNVIIFLLIYNDSDYAFPLIIYYEFIVFINFSEHQPFDFVDFLFLCLYFLIDSFKMNYFLLFYWGLILHSFSACWI